MKQDLKFRAWIPSLKFMGDPFDLREELLNRDQNIGTFPSDCIFLRWTNLKDSNSKDIFEGDILKYHFEDDTHDYMPVFFKDGSFWTGKKDDELLFDDLDPKHGFIIEVAGNIFEHPHLLQP